MPAHRPPASILRRLGAACCVILFVALAAAAWGPSGAPAVNAPRLQPTATPTVVPIGPDNPLGQYVKRHRVQAFVLVTAGGALLAVLVSVLGRRVRRS